MRDAPPRALQSPEDWSFFWLIRSLQADDPDGDSVPIGELGPVSRERVRLKGHPSLSFPKRDVASVQPSQHPEGGRRHDLEVAFLTLFGVDSPLPPHITEAIVRRPGDGAARDFLDIFNHRLLSLLYRGWARYRMHIGCQRWGEDPLTHQLDALVDLPELPDALRYAGLFFQRSRSASGLLQLLQLYLPGVPFAID